MDDPLKSTKGINWIENFLDWLLEVKMCFFSQITLRLSPDFAGERLPAIGGQFNREFYIPYRQHFVDV
ncbi:MAG: hypothetical protein ACLFVK_03570 [Dehalococcoidia bacterium]